MKLTPAQRDLPPGFWSEWTPPASRVSEAIQYPMFDAGWPDRVVNAFMHDWRAGRAAITPTEKIDETHTPAKG